MPADRDILVVAGEASGDLYGSLLIRALRRRNPALTFTGIGGPRMQEAGASLFADSRELAVVGLVEVLSHWRPIHRAYRRARSLLETARPPLLILIDYPDFNLRLAGEARPRGVPVLYFISPQVWAWRRSRVRRIARTVDRMLVVLPFEEEIYRQAGVPVRFVGHPLLDILPAPIDPREARRRMGLDPDRKVVGLLPGSRRREVETHLPLMLEAAAKLHAAGPDFQPVIPLASTVTPGDLAPALAAYRNRIPEVRLLSEPPGVALSAMDAAMVKSGTATLEAGLMGVPMVVVYRTNPATYLLASLLADVRHVGLVNIVAGRRLVPELVQGDCTGPRIAAALGELLDQDDHRAMVRREMLGLRERLGKPGCFERSAEAALELLDRSTTHREDQG